MSETLLTLKQVAARTTMSRSTIYERIKPGSAQYDPTFPRPLKLGPGVTGKIAWIESEIEEWLSAKPRKEI